VDNSESAIQTEIVTLVKRAQGGDQDAYAQLFNEFHQPVLGYIYHTLHDRHAAEDVVQEAFIKAHNRLGQLGPPWDFKSWLFRIASNLAIDYIRSGKRIVNVEDEVMPYLEDPPSTRRPYERRLQREEQKAAVWQSLDELPTHYRQALVLREFNSLSYREVAQALEVSYANARQLVHRARTKFQEIHGLRLVAEKAAERCQVLGDLLSAFHDGELEGEQADQVREHLETCERCQQEREEMRAAGLLLAGLPPLTASEAWKAAVLDQIRLQTPSLQGQATVHQQQGPGSGAEGGSGGGAGSGGGLMSMMAGSGPWLIGALVLAGVVVTAGALILGPYFGGLSPSATSTPFESPPGAESTGTVPAQLTGTEAASAPGIASATATATPTAAPSATPTLGPPQAEALQNSNCRAGPSAESFLSVADMLKGVVVPIDGRSSDDTYWWVEQPDGTGHCYVWKQLVLASGDLESVPFVPDPPTPIPPDEQAPQVSVSHSPSGSGRPTNSDPIIITAQASDNVDVAKIEIWVNGPSDNVAQLVETCSSSSSCKTTVGPYNGGQVEFYARAYDEAGNQSQTPVQSVKIVLLPS
jgi:RNA polymerase sigma-70 factor (ECF subfamily)